MSKISIRVLTNGLSKYDPEVGHCVPVKAGDIWPEKFDSEDDIHELMGEYEIVDEAKEKLMREYDEKKAKEESKVKSKEADKETDG